MCSLPHPAAPEQRQPCLTAVYRSETVRRGQVQPVYTESTWTRRPTPCQTGWRDAELVIGQVTYKAECCFADNGEGCVWQIIDLRQPDGTHYRLVYGPDGETCDCPQQVYRSCRCKHLAAVRALLDWLEEHERLEFEAAVAASAVADHGEVPF